MIRLDYGFILFGVLVLMVVSVNEGLRADPARLGATATGQVRISLVVPPKSQRLQRTEASTPTLTAASNKSVTVGLNDRPVYCLQVPSAGFRVGFVSATHQDGLYLSGRAGRVAYRPTYRHLPASGQCRGQRGEVRLNVRSGGRRQLEEAPHADVLVMVVQPN